ncbi:hypothetical protein [Pseudarthrobacter oxydans]|uniref:hypothetical protein n=1 Tax=Pseudarthrobacter oxydans TaxID=1671 RepID=UPI00344C3725
MAKVAGRKKRIIGTTVALVAIGGGAAFAYWTAAGTGSATTKADTSKNFTITSKITGEPLSPGGPIQTVEYTVTNPGTGVQKLSNVVVTIANDNNSAWTPTSGCSAADFQIVSPTFTPVEIAPNGGTTTGTVTLQMINRDTNQDGCKNASVPLYFSAS